MASMHACSQPTPVIYLPMDITVNKPAKDFPKRKFEAWYTEEIIKQVHGRDLDSMELLPIKLCLTSLKEIGAK